MDDICYSRIICHLHDLPPRLRNRRPTPRLLNGICRNTTVPLSHNHVLGLHHSNSSNVSNPRLCMEIVSSLLQGTPLTCSARRMYFPKEYHYVQEIQKFNVADYRPRFLRPGTQTNLVEWNNFRKQFVKSDKYNECVNSVAMHFLKATRDKCVSFVRTTRLNIAASMER
jgi:hypothetical protein